jgi:hypothetical protein
MQQQDATLPLSGFTHYTPLAQHTLHIEKQQQQQQQLSKLALLMFLPTSPLLLDCVAASPFSCLTGKVRRTVCIHPRLPSSLYKTSAKLSAAHTRRDPLFAVQQE